MSSSKYILNTDGTITKKTVNETEVIENIEDVTRDMISGFNDLESTRTSGDGSIKAAPPLILPLGGLTDFANLSKYDTAVSVDKEGLLKNNSFGTSEDITFYSQFNTIFPKQGGESSTSKIYAEELEMLAGFDLNSIGVFDSTKLAADFVKYTFILDYLLESIAYIAVAEVITRLLKEDNRMFKMQDGENYQFFYVKRNVFHDYFYNVLNYPKFNISKDVEPLAYFLIGLNEFVNTDPKFYGPKGILEEFDIEKTNPNVGNSFITILLDSLLGLSKIEHNRLLLIIRKFQQESHWHKNVLYKAKKDSSENIGDKLFVEFSQYYFKFIIERMHIGRMIWRRKNKKFNKNNDSIRNRLSDDRNIIYMDFTGGNVLKGDNNYVFNSLYMNGVNSFSLTSLPQFLITNEYVKNEKIVNYKLRQNFAIIKNEQKRRLSPDLVKKIEEHLGNEYMPFYFQDLRTNEILAFHAFIDTISDSFSPSYNPSTGYGRIDDVQHYTKTTRTINTTFSLVSYNQDDHDLMWYQINKIVMMVYPQWSKGIKKNDKEVYPFTQMPTASPLIRLRIGDVITSNYSKENLARLHSAKQQKQKKDRPQAQPKAKLKRDLSVLRFDPRLKQHLGESSRDNQDYTLELANMLSLLDSANDAEQKSINDDFMKKFDNDNNLTALGMSDTDIIRKYRFSFWNKNAQIRDSIYRIEAAHDLYIRGDKISFPSRKNPNIKEEYYIASNLEHNDKFYVNAKEIEFPGASQTNYSNNAGKDVVDAIIESKINNPFTAAYESSRGEGLAGFITNLDINYNESTWQTEIKGSRAPMMVKITISFAPIHDIPPGLDHLGEMRAPVYNVGSINRKMFRTPYEDIDN